jgi:hypothetical protein
VESGPEPCALAPLLQRTQTLFEKSGTRWRQLDALNEMCGFMDHGHGGTSSPLGGVIVM